MDLTYQCVVTARPRFALVAAASERLSEYHINGTTVRFPSTARAQTKRIECTEGDIMSSILLRRSMDDSGIISLQPTELARCAC